MSSDLQLESLQATNKLACCLGLGLFLLCRLVRLRPQAGREGSMSPLMLAQATFLILHDAHRCLAAVRTPTDFISRHAA